MIIDAIVVKFFSFICFIYYVQKLEKEECGIKGRWTLRKWFVITKSRVLRGGDPEGLGSYCEEWGIKGKGDPEGLGSCCEKWVLRGGGP